MIFLHSVTISALPLGNLYNLSSNSKWDFVFWIHSDRLHLNKAMSKAPDSVSPSLSQDTHLPVIQFCIVGLYPWKNPNTRLSSLSAAPGFLCISCALLYVSQQSWITLTQRSVKNTSLLRLRIAWDIWSRFIPVPLNLHPKHCRNQGQDPSACKFPTVSDFQGASDLELYSDSKSNLQVLQV